MDDYAAGVGPLQQALRDERAQLQALTEGSPEHHEQVGQVLDAAKAMVAHEGRIPVLRDMARHRINRRIVYATTGAASALMVALGLLAAVGQTSRWYLIPLLIVLTTTVTLASTEHAAERTGHGLRAAAAVLALLVTVAIALIVLHVISAFWQFAAMPALLVAIFIRAGDDSSTPVVEP